jgi:hypothetical protein
MAIDPPAGMTPSATPGMDDDVGFVALTVRVELTPTTTVSGEYETLAAGALTRTV